MEKLKTQLDVGEERIVEQAPQRSWVASHPLSLLLAGACVLVLIGLIIVVGHSTASPTGQTTAWSGEFTPPSGPVATVPNSNGAPTQGNILQSVQGSAPYSYTIPEIGVSQNPATNQPPPSQSLDYQKILPQSSTGSTGASAPAGSTITDISYAFPPQTLFSATSSQTSRTPAQEALYNYGNEVGSYIQTYEQAFPNQTTVLKDQLEDPTNATKVQAIENMAQGLVRIGKSMEAMENVPSAAASAHAAVATAYETMGQNLALVPRAQGTDALLQAINIYNASADSFVKNFVQLASVFSSYGVSFTADEAGSEFMFTYSYQ